jgi:hypothetical protein
LLVVVVREGKETLLLRGVAAVLAVRLLKLFQDLPLHQLFLLPLVVLVELQVLVRIVQQQAAVLAVQVTQGMGVLGQVEHTTGEAAQVVLAQHREVLQTPVVQEALFFLEETAEELLPHKALPRKQIQVLAVAEVHNQVARREMVAQVVQA